MSTQFATAIKKGDESFEIGRAAAQEAHSKLGGGRVDLCLVFGSLSYDLHQVLRSIRSVIGEKAQILGASSCGEFTEDVVGEGSIAVGLLRSDEYRFQVRAASGLRQDVIQVITRIHEEFGDFLQLEGQTSIIMTADGLAGNGEEATLGASALFGVDTTIVGGTAGDELAFQETVVIANDQVLTDAVSVCVVKGPHSLFAGVQHGHEPLSETLEATRAEGSVLYTVNGRKAWEVWKEEARERAMAIGIDVDHLADPSEEGIFLIRFELGLETDAGYKIRVPLSRNEDGSLNFACTIPEGIKFRVMQSKKPAQVRSARRAAELAMEAAGGQEIAGALVFDCVCRSIILGKQFSNAVAAMKEVIGDVPLLGFETYGEICMDPLQFSGFHNTTSVAVLIPAA
ncbi:MAG: FIST C-terminal domain-containing protein [Anaerolineae bacterium]|nr:FIST C-terminal domain-containing protein [Anaerolineae bacterium]